MAKAIKLSRRVVSMFLAMIVLFISLIPITPDLSVSAHNAYVIRSTIDPTNGGYTINVEQEDSGMFAGGHKEENLANFSSVSVNATGKDVQKQFLYGDASSSMWDMMADIPVYDANGRIDTYPEGSVLPIPKEDLVFVKNPSGSKILSFGFPATGDMTQTDGDRATTIANTLGSTLNILIKTVIGNNNNDKNKNIERTMLASAFLDPGLPSGGNPGQTSSFQAEKEFEKYIFVFKNDSSSTLTKTEALEEIEKLFANNKSTITASALKDKLPDMDVDGNFYVYMLEKDKAYSEKEARSIVNSGMIWAMPKGYNLYTALGKERDPQISGRGEATEDVAYMTIFMIAALGNNAFKYGGELTGVQKEAPKSNAVTDLLANIFNTLIFGLMSLLGLHQMDELIFNKGERGGIGFEDGLMQSSWWTVVVKYFTIFQLISWMLIAVAIAKILIQMNLSTIGARPKERAEMIDQIIMMFAIGMALVMCMPVIRLLVQINNALVQVFASSYTGGSLEAPKVNNILVQIVMLFVYFSLIFYTNFVYIMRSITLAILVAIGPLFIVFQAFAKKSPFITWLKELIANIFLQAFHAFAFAFLFEAIASGGGWVERIAVTFSIVPLTEFFRTLLFGQAGGSTIAQGKKLGEAAKNATTSLAGGIAGGAASFAGKALTKKYGGAGDISELEGRASGSKGSARGGGRGAEGDPAGELLAGREAKAQSFASMGANSTGTFKTDSEATASKIKNNSNRVAAVASTIGAVAGGLNDMVSGFNTGDVNSINQGAKAVGSNIGRPVGTAVAAGVNQFSSNSSPAAQTSRFEQENQGLTQQLNSNGALTGNYTLGRNQTAVAIQGTNDLSIQNTKTGEQAGIMKNGTVNGSNLQGSNYIPTVNTTTEKGQNSFEAGKQLSQRKSRVKP